MAERRRTIITIDGIADFVKTEIENTTGRWNDNYYTRDGFYVIHRGREHDVYRTRGDTYAERRARERRSR